MVKSLSLFAHLLLVACVAAGCKVDRVDLDVCRPADPACADEDYDGDGHPNGEDDFPTDDACHERNEQNCARCGQACESDEHCKVTTGDAGFTASECITATLEICDGIDNDLDGQIDETFANLGANCVVGRGECLAAGNMICADDGFSTVCSAVPGLERAELCDGLDNDCDGRIDETFTDLGVQCLIGRGECSGEGHLRCAGDGRSTVCSAVLRRGTRELCDGLDNDCDGQVDEGDVGQYRDCATGMLGICAYGTTFCDGESGIRCRPNVEPSAELCDGFDNNCDGYVDEGNVGQNEDCLIDQPGLCALGTTSCAGESGIRCRANIAPSGEICDGLDNDCDGQVDEGNVGEHQDCNTDEPGVCASGTTHCDGENELQCRRDIEPSEETCDGTDEDCDGEVDNAPSFIDITPIRADRAVSHIVWNGEVYGVAWYRVDRGSAQFSIFSGEDLSLISTIQLDPNRASILDVEWTGAYFLVALNEGPNASIVRVSNNGDRVELAHSSSDVDYSFEVADGIIAWTRVAAGVGVRDEVIFSYLSHGGEPRAHGQQIAVGVGVHNVLLAWDGFQYGIVWSEQDSVESPINVFFLIVSRDGSPVGSPIRIGSGIGRLDLVAGGINQFYMTYSTNNRLTIKLIENEIVTEWYEGNPCANISLVHRTRWNEGGLDVLWSCANQLDLLRFSEDGNLLNTIRINQAALLRGDFVWTGYNYGVAYSNVPRDELVIGRGPLSCAAAVPCADCEDD